MKLYCFFLPAWKNFSFRYYPEFDDMRFKKTFSKGKEYYLYAWTDDKILYKSYKSFHNMEILRVSKFSYDSQITKEILEYCPQFAIDVYQLKSNHGNPMIPMTSAENDVVMDHLDEYIEDAIDDAMYWFYGREKYVYLLKDKYRNALEDFGFFAFLGREYIKEFEYDYNTLNVYIETFREILGKG